MNHEGIRQLRRLARPHHLSHAPRNPMNLLEQIIFRAAIDVVQKRDANQKAWKAAFDVWQQGIAQARAEDGRVGMDYYL